MLGVKFGDLHSKDDLGLILQSVSMPLPAPKVSSIEIGGADGALDLTSYFGDVRYNNRTITMVFTDMSAYRERYDKQTLGASNMHGRSLKLVFDEDPEYYYQARIASVDYAVQGATRTVTVVADCEPYKYLLNEGAEPWLWNPFHFSTGIIRYYGDIEVNGTEDVDVVGGYKAVHPIVEVDSPMTISIDDSPAVFQLKRGVQKVYGITVTRGDHVLHFTGNGKASLKMQIGTF